MSSRKNSNINSQSDANEYDLSVSSKDVSVSEKGSGHGIISKIFSILKKKPETVIISVAFLTGVIIVLIGNLLIKNDMHNVRFIYSGEQESTARSIEIDASEQKKRASKMKTFGQKGDFTFFNDTDIYFENNYSSGVLRMGSPESNKYILVAAVLGDNDDLWFRSDGILPGQYLPEMRLYKPLDDGEYKTKLYVCAYDSESFEMVGARYTYITIHVGNESE